MSLCAYSAPASRRPRKGRHDKVRSTFDVLRWKFEVQFCGCGCPTSNVATSRPASLRPPQWATRFGSSARRHPARNRTRWSAWHCLNPHHRGPARGRERSRFSKTPSAGNVRAMAVLQPLSADTRLRPWDARSWGRSIDYSCLARARWSNIRWRHRACR